MSAIGSVSADPAFAAQELPKKSVKDVPDIAFGKVKWEKYFGGIGVEPPLPPNTEKILDSPCPFWLDKKVKETHLLVLVPETVNGKPFHLDALGEMIKVPKTGHKTKYRMYNDYVKEELGKKGGKSHWVLMTRDVIPGSRGKRYEKQKVLAEKHTGRNGVAYRVPKVLEAATAILMEHASTGTRLYPDDPCTWTRCEEKVYHSLKSVAIGGMSSEGIRPCCFIYGYVCGVAACLSLGISE